MGGGGGGGGGGGSGPPVGLLGGPLAPPSPPGSYSTAPEPVSFGVHLVARILMEW